MNEYKVHMISLQMKGSNGYSCVFGNGENLGAGHLEAVREWLYRMENPGLKKPEPTLDDLL